MKLEVLEDIVAIAAGVDHVLALDRFGGVWTWGDIESVPTSERVRVSFPTPADIVKIKAGGGTSYAIDKDGHIWSWGWDTYGQCGRVAPVVTGKPNSSPRYRDYLTRWLDPGQVTLETQ